MISKYLTR